MEEQLVISGVRNMARMWEAPARAMGWRWVRWNDAWAVDSALPGRFFNRVIIIRPLDPSGAGELAERIVRFYTQGPGDSQFVAVDTWGTLDLGPYGFEQLWSLPFMVRPARGPEGPRSEFEIMEARTHDDMDGFVKALVEGFAISELNEVPTSQVMDERVLAGASMRCWVAIQGGRTVGGSVAYHSDGVVGVYMVGVVPAMRRRGLGEALTWRATLSDPTLPCTLQASRGGRPIYEKMGYVTAAECVFWINPR